MCLFRDQSYGLIIEAIKRAILQQSTAKPTQPPAPLPAPVAAPVPTVTEENKDQVHEEKAKEVITDSRSLLKESLVEKYGTAKAAFDAFNREEAVTKKEWKRMIAKLLPDLTQGDAKKLKKKLPKKLGLAKFCTFVGGSPQAESVDVKKEENEHPHLARLPPEVIPLS